MSMSPSNFIRKFYIDFIDATLYQTKILRIAIFMLSSFLSFFENGDIQ